MAKPAPLPVKPPLYSHQAEYEKLRSAAAIHALFWEQGTAKTRPVIENVAKLYREGVVDALLVVAPRGADRNWANEEIPNWMPPDILAKAKTMCWQGRKARTKWHQYEFEDLWKHDGLAILTIQYASFARERAKKAIWKFLRKRKVFYVLDESSGIKSPSAKRSISIQASGRYATYKRLLDGTPVAEGPFDIYMPVMFLDEKFWKRHDVWNYGAFKAKFGLWLTRAEAQEQAGWDPGYDQLIEYQNLDILHEWLQELSTRVLKEDVLDLPPKLFGKLEYVASDYQKQIYEDLKTDYIHIFKDGRTITADLAIVRMMRFQQLLAGYLPDDNGEPSQLLEKTNFRLDCLDQNATHLGTQGIVWTRFLKDIDLIKDMWGKKAVTYDGRLTDDELERNKKSFQAGDVQWFIGNSQMSSSLTLHMAHTVFFYTNSHKLRDRLQAEDRAHRAGLTHSVDYRDIISDMPIDRNIVEALRNKLDISRIITGDKLKEWI